MSAIEEMTPKTASAEITILRMTIRELNTAYYVRNQSPVPDVEYDRMLRRLDALEQRFPEFASPDSPTQIVGGEPITAFEQQQHVIPMLSIENCFTWEDLDKWHAGNLKALGEEPLYAVDFKVDGLAVSIRYEAGKLVSATTRGDGQVGELITHNIRTVRGVPLLLDDGVERTRIVEVRGEVFISHSDFAKVLQAQRDNGEELFANSRNAASGAIRQLDPKQCAARRCRFFAHGFGMLSGNSGDKLAPHGALMAWFQSLGIPGVPYAQCGMRYDTAKQYAEHLIERLPELDFPIDGIVFKIDSRAHRKTLGAGTKHPHWCRAYKWERYEAPTKVRDITVQVGKQGTLTPVAELEPVIIAETEVTRASLFNKDEIARLGLRIGDTVIVEKAGKIIPHIVRVDLSQRPADAVPYVFPTSCPACDSPALPDGVQVVCTNIGCPAKLQAVLEAFCDRSRMDIEGMGPGVVSTLIKSGFVNSIPDLYRLAANKSQLAAMRVIGAKTLESIIERIEASKQQPVWRLVAGLNIKHIGRTYAKRLMEHLKPADITEHPTVWFTAEKLAGVNVGPAALDSFREYLGLQHGTRTLQELKQLGCKMGVGETVPPPPAAGNTLAGMVFVVTGTMASGNTREQTHAMIEAFGGVCSDSVNKKTTYLVAGDKAGSKVAKAEKAGVKVITEADLVNLIEGNPLS